MRGNLNRMTQNQLDIEANRSAVKYPLSVQVRRVAWALGKVVFRLVPRPFHGPRRVLLRMFGARIGRQVNVSNTALIFFPWNLEVGDWSAIGEGAIIYNLGNISIGRQVTISQYAHLCAGTHDFRDPAMPLLTPPIHIGDQAWICADAFVGPGVRIGEGAVVGACSVVMRNVGEWDVVAGNPAVVVRKRELRTGEGK